MYKPAPHVINIGKDCGEYLRILDGPPQSVTMRSGRVTIAPGKSVGTHSTGDYEELVIVLEGQGEARPAGHPPMIFEAGDAVYVPPETDHDMANTGKDILRYVYVVAKAKQAS